VSFSPHLLKIMGTEVAEQLLDPHRTAEQRLYQAIIVQAFEDCLYTNGGKNESYKASVRTRITAIRKKLKI
jgi:hypothetical protein